MAKGVTRITFEINSVPYAFFNAFTENERIISDQVFYMNSTGQKQLLQRHTFSMDRVRTLGDTFDFDGVEEGTVTIEYEGGGRITFVGVHTMSIGPETADGESDMVSSIAFGASDRIVN